MTVNDFVDNIKLISESIIDSRPSTNFGRVIKYYQNTVTVETDDGVLENIKCVNIPKVGSPCVLLPIGEEFVCIPTEMDEYTKEEIDEIVADIISGQIDLNRYIRKDEFLDLFDVDFDYTLGNPLEFTDGVLNLDIFLKNK